MRLAISDERCARRLWVDTVEKGPAWRGRVGDLKEGGSATNCRLTTDERSEVSSVTSRLSPEKKHGYEVTGPRTDVARLGRGE